MVEWVINILQLAVVAVLPAGLITTSFLLFMGHLRPHLHISTVITKVETKKYMRKSAYVITIANRSRRTLADLKAQLALIQETNSPTSVTSSMIKIALEEDSLIELPGADNAGFEANSFRFVTFEEIETKWNDNNTLLVLTVYAKDALTGFNKVFRMKYDSSQLIADEGTVMTGISRKLPGAL